MFNLFTFWTRRCVVVLAKETKTAKKPCFVQLTFIERSLISESFPKGWKTNFHIKRCRILRRFHKYKLQYLKKCRNNKLFQNNRQFSRKSGKSAKFTRYLEITFICAFLTVASRYFWNLRKILRPLIPIKYILYKKFYTPDPIINKGQETKILFLLFAIFFHQIHHISIWLLL
jgi:hypothetical protein